MPFALAPSAVEHTSHDPLQAELQQTLSEQKADKQLELMLHAEPFGEAPTETTISSVSEMLLLSRQPEVLPQMHATPACRTVARTAWFPDGRPRVKEPKTLVLQVWVEISVHEGDDAFGAYRMSMKSDTVLPHDAVIVTLTVSPGVKLTPAASVSVMLSI